MRSRKYRVMTTLERGSNRLIRVVLRAGFAPRSFALLETPGRRTGLARHTPVGNGLDGDTFWLACLAQIMSSAVPVSVTAASSRSICALHKACLATFSQVPSA